MALLKFPSASAAKVADRIVTKWRHTIKPSFLSAVAREIGLALDEAAARESMACGRMFRRNRNYFGVNLRARRARLYGAKP